VIGVVIGLVIAGFVFILVLASLIALVVRKLSLVKLLGYGFGAVVALFAIGRAIAEFLIINYSDPASYRHSWGGPSLFGVFLVHAGPGAAVLIAGFGYLFRWWPRSRRDGTLENIAEREPEQQLR